MRTLAEAELELDRLTTVVMVPLRSTKALDLEGLASLMSLGDELTEALQGRADVPVSLVGKAIFVFTAMLGEADHARDPEPIRDAAWQWAEKLRLAFGPRFPERP